MDRCYIVDEWMFYDIAFDHRTMTWLGRRNPFIGYCFSAINSETSVEPDASSENN